MKKVLRISGIIAMVLCLFSLGIYLAHPAKVKAGTLKFLGLYGLGDGLYPLKGSQTGEIKKIFFNGRPSIFLSCSIDKPASAVVKQYSRILRDHSANITIKTGPGRKVVSRKFFGTTGAFYSILSAKNSKGDDLGVVIFSLSSKKTKYYLCRSLDLKKSQRMEMILPPPSAKAIFILEESQAKRGLYFFKSRLSLKKTVLGYRRALKRRGWKEWSHFSKTLQQNSAPAMVFTKKNLQALLCFYRNRKKEVTLTMMIRPLNFKKKP